MKNTGHLGSVSGLWLMGIIDEIDQGNKRADPELQTCHWKGCLMSSAVLPTQPPSDLELKKSQDSIEDSLLTIFNVIVVLLCVLCGLGALAGFAMSPLNRVASFREPFDFTFADVLVMMSVLYGLPLVLLATTCSIFSIFVAGVRLCLSLPREQVSLGWRVLLGIASFPLFQLFFYPLLALAMEKLNASKGAFRLARSCHQYAAGYFAFATIIVMELLGGTRSIVTLVMGRSPSIDFWARVQMVGVGVGVIVFFALAIWFLCLLRWTRQELRVGRLRSKTNLFAS